MENFHFLDLHIHSAYSRATSPQLNLENIHLWALKKGISVIGTGDFTHPIWFKELKNKLTSNNNSFYSLKNKLTSNKSINFALTGEVSLIYKKNNKVRKVHLLILAPNLEAAEKFSKKLATLGNIEADGRPILGISAKNILEIALNISSEFEIIPAHIWTPWFSLFGSKSGFDTLEECFEDLSPHIRALETGLSSDPEMNRLISALDKYNLVSFSDAHSLEKIGREVTVLSGELNYKNLLKALRKGENLVGTFEFFPQEGKYYLDGHLKCGVSFSPKESRALAGLCPVCQKPLTEGVLNRIWQLGDREKAPENLLLKNQHLVPLEEILAQIYKQGVKTKKVQSAYSYLIENITSELHILNNVSISDLKILGGDLLALSIKKMRENKVAVEGGYDGQFGSVQLLSEAERLEFKNYGPLFEKIKMAK